MWRSEGLVVKSFRGYPFKEGATHWP